MGLESATYLSSLVSTNPVVSDDVGQGDDHIRLLKSVLQSTFPNSDKAFRFPDSVNKTADYTVLSTDQNKLITADATSAAIALTLPTLTSSDDGWLCFIAKTDSSANAVTVTGTINGTSNFAIDAQYQGALVLWTGSAWILFPLLADVSGSVKTKSLTVTTLTVTGAGSVAGVLMLSSTSHMIAPGGTTAQRPGSPAGNEFRINTDTNQLEYYSGGSWRTIGTVFLPQGYINGFNLTNNGSAASTDIDIAAGSCRDSTNSVNIVVTAMTKRLSSTWVAGSAQGMRSSASLADGSWHLFAIAKADGTADYLAHNGLDPTSVLPSGYLYFRRIRSFLRESGSIIAFYNKANLMLRLVDALDGNGISVTTSRNLRTLSIPTGLRMLAKLTATIVSNSGGPAFIFSPDITDPTMSATSGPGNFAWAVTTNMTTGSSEMEVLTNTSAQVADKGSATTVYYLRTHGWWDFLED